MWELCGESLKIGGLVAADDQIRSSKNLEEKINFKGED